jgi:hypothetical protein
MLLMGEMSWSLSGGIWDSLWGAGCPVLETRRDFLTQNSVLEYLILEKGFSVKQRN